MIETFKVFFDRPANFIFGVGPGGIGAYMVNSPHFSVAADSFERLWATEPSNITAEILASVGIIGFGIFAWFMIIISNALV